MCCASIASGSLFRALWLCPKHAWLVSSSSSDPPSAEATETFPHNHIRWPDHQPCDLVIFVLRTLASSPAHAKTATALCLRGRSYEHAGVEAERCIAPAGPRPSPHTCAPSPRLPAMICMLMSKFSHFKRKRVGRSPHGCRRLDLEALPVQAPHTRVLWKRLS